MRKYDPPCVTLSALTEIGQEELTIPVLKQRSYTGKMVISSALADTLCTDLGVQGILEKLNMIFGTSYTLDSGILHSVLQSYIRQKSDFGNAYTHLHFYWYNMAVIKDRLCMDEEKDQKMRRKVLVDGRITTPKVPPRRLWDLYANRVVPYAVALTDQWWAISHAWVDEKDRVMVMTPINGYEWPVPMPKDANLDLIRIEMLNHGAMYVWLDVLCLRQVGLHEKEDLRREEWKLDVPTIGHVYDYTRVDWVVSYLSGLGRPLSFKMDDFESDRCWFNRAWTLQEIWDHNAVIIAGDAGDDSGFMEEETRTRVHEQLGLLHHRAALYTFQLLSLMRNRASTKTLDKVAGLVYLLHPTYIPIYDAAQSEEDAWAVLVDAMGCLSRAELFFYFPGCGNGKKCWRPSWEQVMTVLPVPFYAEFRTVGVNRTEQRDSDWCEAPSIPSVYVSGLSDTSDKPRQGELFLKNDTGIFRTSTVIAEHTYPISDGWYTLIGTKKGHVSVTCVRRNCWGLMDIWVIGQLRKDGTFQKVSVVRILDNETSWQCAVTKYLRIDLC